MRAIGVEPHEGQPLVDEVLGHQAGHHRLADPALLAADEIRCWTWTSLCLETGSDRIRDRAGLEPSALPACQARGRYSHLATSERPRYRGWAPHTDRVGESTRGGGRQEAHRLNGDHVRASSAWSRSRAGRQAAPVGVVTLRDAMPVNSWDSREHHGSRSHAFNRFLRPRSLSPRGTAFRMPPRRSTRRRRTPRRRGYHVGTMIRTADPSGLGNRFWTPRRLHALLDLLGALVTTSCGRGSRPSGRAVRGART